MKVDKSHVNKHYISQKEHMSNNSNECTILATEEWDDLRRFIEVFRESFKLSLMARARILKRISVFYIFWPTSRFFTFFFCTSETCFSILTLTKLHKFCLRISWLYPEKILPLITRARFFWNSWICTFFHPTHDFRCYFFHFFRTSETCFS